jgi:hypothetical protein
MLVVRLASRLFFFLFPVATRGRVTLVALAAVIPPVPEASSGGATDKHSFAMALRPRGQIPSGRHWMLLVELHECARSDTAAFVSEGWVVVVGLVELLLRWR